MILLSKEPGFILHRQAYRENSYLLDILLRESGRIRGVLKINARHKQKTGTTACEPFRLTHFDGIKRQGELFSLYRIESLKDRVCQIKDIILLSYVNELILKTIPQETRINGLFSHYQQVLAKPSPAGLRRFEYFLFDELGILPEWRKQDQHAPYFRLGHDDGVIRFIPAETGITADQVRAFMQQEINEENAIELKIISRGILRYNHYLNIKTQRTLQDWHHLMQT